MGSFSGDFPKFRTTILLAKLGFNTETNLDVHLKQWRGAWNIRKAGRLIIPWRMLEA
jgi:hypothetical protein